jgi:hypothetical protein
MRGESGISPSSRWISSPLPGLNLASLQLAQFAKFAREGYHSPLCIPDENF